MMPSIQQHLSSVYNSIANAEIICGEACLIPSDEIMLIKNVPELQNIALCPFLQDIDEKEKAIQNKWRKKFNINERNKVDVQNKFDEVDKQEYRATLLIGERKTWRVGYAILGGAIGGGGGVVIGIIPVIGLICSGLCAHIGNLYATHAINVKIKGCRAYLPRMERMKKKIISISEQLRIHNQSREEIDQLTKANIYLQFKVTYYEELADRTPDSSTYEWPDISASSVGHNLTNRITYHYQPDGTCTTTGTLYHAHIHSISDSTMRTDYYTIRKEEIKG